MSHKQHPFGPKVCNNSNCNNNVRDNNVRDNNVSDNSNWTSIKSS